MKFLKWLLIVVAVLTMAVIGYGYSLPDKSQMQRSTLIAAPPATVYTVLNGFRQFNKWSPWAELDPNTAYTFEGPLTGVGARMSWISQDPNVGAGSQEILAAVPNQSITIKLVFADFATDNVSAYALAPVEGGTQVTWSYEGDAKGSILYRYFGLMTDSMIGPDYEKGLAKLKTLVESLPKADFSTAQIELLETQAQPIAYTYVELDAAQAATVLAAAYAKVGAFMTLNQLKQAGAPMTVTHAFDEATRFWKCDAAIPVDRSDVASAPESDVKVGASYAGKAVRIVHKGNLQAMEPSYAQLLAYMAAAGLESNGNSWEQYVTDPGAVPEAELVTHIYSPVK